MLAASSCAFEVTALLLCVDCGTCGWHQSRVDRMRQKALQSKLRASLASLPEPQYTYEIEVPEVCVVPVPLRVHARMRARHPALAPPPLHSLSTRTH
jgi:hypothetical protein